MQSYWRIVFVTALHHTGTIRVLDLQIQSLHEEAAEELAGGTLDVRVAPAAVTAILISRFLSLSSSVLCGQYMLSCHRLDGLHNFSCSDSMLAMDSPSLRAALDVQENEVGKHTAAIKALSMSIITCRRPAMTFITSSLSHALSSSRH